MRTNLITIRHPKVLGVMALLGTLAAVNCAADAASPAGPSPSPAAPAATSYPVSNVPPVGTTAAPGTSTPELLAALTAAIQDEYHAQAVYERVLLDFGPVLPFANIVRAERTHAASLAALFQSRGAAVPVSAWNVDNVPRFASVSDACAAAASAEIDNVAVYDAYPPDTLPADVARVFANNRAASLNNHLPAFNACR